MGNVLRSRQVQVLATGLAGVAVITAALLPLGSLSHTVPPLLYLVPIAGTSVFGSWRVSMGVAFAAGAAYALAFLPPVGTLSIGLTEDIVALVTFLVVAVALSLLKGAGDRRRSGGANVLDDQRAVLLRGVSHDLRNPLNTIRLVSSDLLAGGAHDDGERDLMLGLMVEESQRLDRIVGNLLSLSRVQAGSFLPDLSLQSIDDLAADVVARLSRLHRRPIAIAITDDLPDVWADPVQIDQVLTNLLENALRYSPPEGAIIVEAVAADDEVVVTVGDEGPGVPELIRKQLFIEPIAAGDSSGLGLTVCKAIIDAHGGRIWARPPRPTGTRVSFSLPVAR